MADTSIRLLQLLTLLHARSDLGGAELADRLGVAPRTLRRDVERLRSLGYPVRAEQGSAGYRLGSGAQLPPLILGDDEAVAVVLGLRAAAQQSISGIEDAAVAALTKLEQVLPSRLKHRVQTIAAATVYGGDPAEAAVDIEVLLAVSEACRRRECLRFDYAGRGGPESRREAEPYRLICFNRRWYLVAFDLGREDWRTFRVDRLRPRTPLGRRFEQRAIPHGDALTYLEHQLSAEAWSVRAVFRLRVGADRAAQNVWPGMGAIEPEGADSCLLHLGAPDARELCWMITSVNLDFEVVEGPRELIEDLRRQSERSLAAIGSVGGKE